VSGKRSHLRVDRQEDLLKGELDSIFVCVLDRLPLFGQQLVSSD
jgi:hypothetical protein